MNDDNRSNSQSEAFEENPQKIRLPETVDGIETKSVDDWKEFCHLICHEFSQKKGGKSYIGDYVWRGHRCESWKLVSSFDRKGQRTKLNQHLNSFVYACRGKLERFGISVREFKRDIRRKVLNLNHLWALGQHYDLETPLLDWSYSPFVAAFFAFVEETEPEDFAKNKLKEILNNDSATKPDFVNKLKECAERRAVIGLNISHLKKFRREDLYDSSCKIPTLDYFDPMSSEYPRLINQRGLFTVIRNKREDNDRDKTGEYYKDIEEKCIGGIVRNCQIGKSEDAPPWIVKILIPNDKRVEFLRALNLMNINHMTLFPEVYGAAKFCNIGMEDGLDDYAVFHGQGI